MIKWLIPCFFVAQIHASEFPVVIGETAYNSMPGLADRVVSALQEQGLAAKLTVEPGDRALHLLRNGQFALDIIRHSRVVKNYTELRQISHPVINMHWSRIVSSSVKENCTNSATDLSIVGIKGIRAFEGVIVPKFKSITWVSTESLAFRMISAQRTDITYWMSDHLGAVHKDYADTLTVCAENDINVVLHSYVHSDYEWAMPKVEAAYAQLFGQN